MIWLTPRMYLPAVAFSQRTGIILEGSLKDPGTVAPHTEFHLWFYQAVYMMWKQCKDEIRQNITYHQKLKMKLEVKKWYSTYLFLGILKFQKLEQLFLLEESLFNIWKDLSTFSVTSWRRREQKMKDKIKLRETWKSFFKPFNVLLGILIICTLVLVVLNWKHYYR